MVTLIDSYSESNKTYDWDLNNSWGENGIGQSFTNTNEITLDSCKFYLQRTGALTGNLTAHLYAHTGTYPSSSMPGDLLASSTAIDISTIGTSYALVTFNFTGANRVTLAASTYYIITVEPTSTTGEEDFISCGVDEVTMGHSGALLSKFEEDWYNQYDIYDCCFYVYGEATATGTNISLNVGDVWKDVTNAYVNVGDVWKEVASASVNVGDVWKTIF